MYTEFIKKYEDEVSEHAKEIWKELSNKLKVINDISDIRAFEEFLSSINRIEIRKELVNAKGYAKYEDDIFLICVDFTNAIQINRFTIAHELAHILFDTDKLISGEMMESDYIENEIFHDEIEVRANKFAVELLVPEVELRKTISQMFIDKRKTDGDDAILTLNEVSPTLREHFYVSHSIIENRMRTLSMIK